MKKIIFVINIVALASSCSSNQHGKEQKKEDGATAHYKLINIAKGGVTTDLRLPAQLAAYEEVSIFPKVNGYVKDVLVDIGSHVHKGQLLMVLDVPEFKQAVSEQKEKYNQAESDFAIAKENYQRLLEASATPGAVSMMDLSAAKSRMVSATALSNAAKANLAIQNTQADYVHITAPFAGVITERNVHPGALVSATAKDKPMLELKQMDRLRLQVDVPESIATGLQVNDSLSFVAGGSKMTAIVSRKSESINPQFRSERIEADVINNGSLASGMYADVIFHATGNAAAFHIPKSALIVSTQGKYVIAVQNDKTVKVNVSTGAESANEIEITGNIQDGDSIIANASEEIPEGVKVN